MNSIFKFIAQLGELTIFITPLTFTIGIINSINKVDKEAKVYKSMAIVSAYLIIIPLVFNSIYN